MTNGRSHTLLRVCSVFMFRTLISHAHRTRNSVGWMDCRMHMPTTTVGFGNAVPLQCSAREHSSTPMLEHFSSTEFIVFDQIAKILKTLGMMRSGAVGFGRTAADTEFAIKFANEFGKVCTK